MGMFGKKEPEQVEVLGKVLSCQICGGEDFWHRKAQLNTALASFFDLDWSNPSANCVICAQCGHIYWFMPLKPAK